ncbi:rhodanese-like domain-containing protein [Fictibacillus fluitans]|uniref:Rhodanese-like domain-containing protein n=1 Tax=Fictibacillus fluitans TaxID=3058422 RepID=A0ABT8HRF0_9BACL|nr:rhodanese-like domain-containing protein [Fictibacillus sp. NE201]MDN4523348.1 rhodanese-like domain-containing protein [Fictibacillus sp. NE201]
MYKKITPEEVAKRIESGKEINVIDVREKEEVEQGMIPGATHIPLGDLPNQYTRLDNNKEYILVCRSGKRSGKACEFLSEKSMNVKNMTGGMLAWEKERK